MIRTRASWLSIQSVTHRPLNPLPTQHADVTVSSETAHIAVCDWRRDEVDSNKNGNDVVPILIARQALVTHSHAALYHAHCN